MKLLRCILTDAAVSSCHVQCLGLTTLDISTGENNPYQLGNKNLRGENLGVFVGFFSCVENVRGLAGFLVKLATLKCYI